MQMVFEQSSMPRIKFEAYLNMKNSIIDEVDEDEDLGLSRAGANNFDLSINNYQEGAIKKSLMMKRAIR